MPHSDPGKPFAAFRQAVTAAGCGNCPAQPRLPGSERHIVLSSRKTRRRLWCSQCASSPLCLASCSCSYDFSAISPSADAKRVDAHRIVRLRTRKIAEPVAVARDQFRIDAFEGHLVPAAVIALPGAWHVLRARRREEPGEDGSLGVKAHDLLDEALQPNLACSSAVVIGRHRPATLKKLLLRKRAIF